MPPSEALAGAHDHLVVIGASTGGTEAIKQVLMALDAHCPGILIVQHMPERFTGSFAARLDALCALRVKEAENGEPVLAGHAYLAPGHSHLLVRRAARGYRTELSAAEPVNRHRPAVDVLFRSAAAQAGPNALGVLLTGMGKDGAQGLLEMRRTGAFTVAQDERTSTVYGMPKEAASLNAAEIILPLSEIASALLARLRLAQPCVPARR